MTCFALPDDLEPAFGAPLVRQAGGATLPEQVLHRPTGLRLVLVPAGRGMQGSQEGEGQPDERPRHEVVFGRPVYVGIAPITRAEWARLGDGLEVAGGEAFTMTEADGVADFHRDERASWRDPLPNLGFSPGDDHPVTMVSWYDAVAFCRRHGLRLPTEAEAEWAHRGGAATRYWWGDDPAGAAGRGNLCDRALRGRFRNFRVDGRLFDLPSFDHDDGFPFTSPVGTFAANPFGLFDVTGNVWEWCEDVYDAAAYARRSPDGHLPWVGPGPRRVLRGASWDNGPNGARCARRYSERAELRLVNVGFRVVRDVVAAAAPPPPLAPGAAEHAERLIARARRVLTQEWAFGSVWAMEHEGRPYPHLVERVDGAHFVDVAGRRHLDWFVGGGVVTLGHRHPDVQRAMEVQLERGVHLSLQGELEITVAERLCALFPGAEQVAFGKNGSDVTSAAVRLARAATGREHVLACGYHGWQDWSKAADPAVPGIPGALRGLVHEFRFGDLEHAGALLRAHTGAVAAIVVEPVRHAEPPPGFLAGLRELADAHGCALVFDEVVTGLRVARGGAQALYGVVPDLTCLAKSLANGLPLAALAGRRAWMKRLPPTFFAPTYQREVLSLAAADAALAVHATHDVAGHLARLGEGLRSGFAALAARHGVPFELRGHPTMLHLHADPFGRLLPPGAIALFTECLQRQGVYFAPHRWLPSFAHSGDDVVTALAAIDAALATVRRAAEEGLAGHLDSPVWGDFEVAAPPPPAAPTLRTPAPAPAWLQAPPVVTAAGVAIHAPAGAGALSVATCGRAGTERRSIELLAPLEGDGRVTARLRFCEWDPGDANVVVALAAGAVAGGEWTEIVHSSSTGQMPRFRAACRGRARAVAGLYGAPSFVLGIERRGAAWTLRGGDGGDGAGDGDAEALLTTEGPTGPLRLWLQLRVTGPLRRPVVVEVDELRLAPL